MKQQSIGREAAIALEATKWWEGKSAHEIASFQMATQELCMPFDEFHKAIEAALNRPVWTHEFGLNRDGLREELQGNKPAPSFQDILDLIPPEKRIILEL